MNKLERILYISTPEEKNDCKSVKLMHGHSINRIQSCYSIILTKTFNDNPPQHQKTWKTGSSVRLLDIYTHFIYTPQTHFFDLYDFITYYVLIFYSFTNVLCGFVSFLTFPTTAIL